MCSSVRTQNYRGIKLLYHTMKIWEHIVDKRVRGEVEVAEEQFGFMPGRGTTNAIAIYSMTDG